RIDTPRSGTPRSRVHTIAGVAFAGDRGISKVEVTMDNAATWHEATLKTALSPHAWRLWRFVPRPQDLRAARLVSVRAVDGTGAVQPPAASDPFPAGSAGYHAIAPA